MRSLFYNLLFFSMLFGAADCFAESVLLDLNGHLSAEKMEAAQKELASSPSEIGLIIHSSSGDLNAILSLAKRIYELKVENKAKVLVYIEDNAVGPAAIFPFLADEITISTLVSWGDIQLGTDGAMQTNLLKNRVRSLVVSSQEKASELRLLALGMSDPNVSLTGTKTVALAVKNDPLISGDGEALVLNQNQLQELGLAKMGEVTLFREQFDTKKIETPKKDTTTFKEHILFNAKGPNTIGRIYIGDQATAISQATWIYVKNALDYYKKTKPSFIILELNTPGGEVYAAQKISDALKEMDTQYGIPCVAFINNWALSAGAMLGYSCRYITVVKDGSMGAAEPVFVGEGGQMVSAPEKINSALRADFANRARFFDRNPDIAEAMVDKDIILVERFGKIMQLSSADDIRKKGPSPDKVISAGGKLLTLNSKELIELGVANLLLPPEKLVPITSEEETEGKWPASKMLLFQQPFFNSIPDATVVTWQMDWKTKLFSLLAGPMVSSLLFLAMMIGFYVEINSPGFGVPGSIGLIALFLIVLSSFALDVANILELVLFLVGICFIALDIFLIPTFGLLGIVGVILALIGLFGIMLPNIGSVEFEFDTQTFNAAGDVFLQRLGYLSATFVVGVILIGLLARYVMPSFAGFKRLVLTGDEQEGFIASDAPNTLPQPGERGEVLATLRPAGKVMINDQIYDAITYGQFVERGEKIQVIALDGSVIVVDVLEEEVL